MSETETTEEIAQPSPGSLLKAARENAGLSIEQIAAKLHLKVSSIEDIEGDHFDPNISTTFTRGYLKLYAKHVGVDETGVLEAYEGMNTEHKEPAKLQSFSRRVARQASDDRLMLVTYLIIAVVIALVILWWFQQSDSETVSHSAAQPNTETAVVTDAGVPQTDTQARDAAVGAEPQPHQEATLAEKVPEQPDISTSVDTLENDTETAIEAATQVAQDATAETQPPVNAPAVEVAAEPTDASVQNDTPQASIELVFTFSGDCWMNLTDATGEAIAYGVKAGGRVMPVSGVPPFEVTLGAPEVVQISYNGEPVDMSGFQAGRTARFNLPLGG